MNHLLRELAPITEHTWSAIDDEARESLKATLAARKLIDFRGPLGWETFGVDLGTVKRLRAPESGVTVKQREALPMVEIRVPFDLPRASLEAIARGAPQVPLDEVADAARKIAMAEDRIVFEGYEAAGIVGIMAGSEHKPVSIDEDYEKYPQAVGQAIAALREAGIGGPYSIALGPKCYTGLTTTTSGGYPVLEHVRRLIEGSIVWAPGIDGACVLSARGGDYELIVGQDLSVGYLSSTDDTVRLYLEESLTFRAADPGAAVPLRYKKTRKR